jgi:hypothetical protein
LEGEGRNIALARLAHRRLALGRKGFGAGGRPMVTVAVTTSQVVLWRFAQDQQSNLRLLAGAYLDGLSAAVLPALVRRNVRALFDALDRARGDRYAGIEPRYAILVLPNGLVIASFDPRRFPVQSAVPDELRRRFASDRDGLDTDPDTDRAWLARTLRTEEGLKVGRLFAEVDIAASLRVRREILFTLVLVNGCLTLAFALGGYFVLKRMMEAGNTDGRQEYQLRGVDRSWAASRRSLQSLPDFFFPPATRPKRRQPTITTGLGPWCGEILCREHRWPALSA